MRANFRLHSGRAATLAAPSTRGPRLKLFYGWRISFAGASIQFLHSALLVQAFGAYVAVLSEEKGWSKTALAAGAALQSIEGALQIGRASCRERV